MKVVSRIPEIKVINKRNMYRWFSKMSDRDLLFHPDDDPATIVNIRTGVRVFSKDEVRHLRELIDGMFARQGNIVYDAAYPVFMSVFREVVNG